MSSLQVARVGSEKSCGGGRRSAGHVAMSETPNPRHERLLLDLRIRRALLWLIRLTVAGAFIALTIYLRPVISLVLTVASPFMMALIVAYIFNPVVRALQYRFSVGRVGGVLITYALIVTVTAGTFAVVIPLLYSQMRAAAGFVISNVPGIVDTTLGALQGLVSPEDAQQIREAIDQHLDLSQFAGTAGTAVRAAAQQTATTALNIGQFIVSAVLVAIGLIVFTVFVIVITFYMLLDFTRIGYMVRVALPTAHRRRFMEIWAKVDKALGGLIRGQLTVCVILTVLYSITLFLFGMKQYAFLVAFMAGFGNLIPYLGPTLGAVPTAAWVLVTDVYGTGTEKLLALGVIAIFTAIIQGLDGFVFQPRIVGSNAELHPLLIIFALFIGAQFGIGGVIMAAPTACVARVLIKELWWDRRLAAVRASQGEADIGDPLDDPDGDSRA